MPPYSPALLSKTLQALVGLAEGVINTRTTFAAVAPSMVVEVVNQWSCLDPELSTFLLGLLIPAIPTLLM